MPLLLLLCFPALHPTELENCVSQPAFRAAAEADAEQLLDFMQVYYAYDGHGFDREKSRAALTTLLRDESLGKIWIIFDAEKPVGYIVLCFGYSLEWLGRDALVDEFFLLENYRGRGWGSKIMSFLEDEARKFGVRVIHLEVIEGNPAAHLYQKLGFEPHHSTFYSKWVAKDFSKPPRVPARHDS
jgi:diamine N-acetyltransferase